MFHRQPGHATRGFIPDGLAAQPLNIENIGSLQNIMLSYLERSPRWDMNTCGTFFSLPICAHNAAMRFNCTPYGRAATIYRRCTIGLLHNS